MGSSIKHCSWIYGGGLSPTDHADIEYVTIATLGDALILVI